MSWILMGRSSNYTVVLLDPVILPGQWALHGHDPHQLCLFAAGNLVEKWMVCQGIILRFFYVFLKRLCHVRICIEYGLNMSEYSLKIPAISFDVLIFFDPKQRNVAESLPKPKRMPLSLGPGPSRMSRGSGMEKLFLPENAQKLKETCAVYPLVMTNIAIENGHL